MGFTPPRLLPFRTPPTLHLFSFLPPLPSPPSLWCPRPLPSRLSGYIVSNLNELTFIFLFTFMALLSSKLLIGVWSILTPSVSTWVLDLSEQCYSFFICLHTFSKLYLFLSKLNTQIQELHTQNAKCLTSLAKWHTAFKRSQTHLKSKHLSYVANTFAIIIYFWICHMYTQ